MAETPPTMVQVAISPRQVRGLRISQGVAPRAGRGRFRLGEFRRSQRRERNPITPAMAERAGRSPSSRSRNLLVPP